MGNHLILSVMSATVEPRSFQPKPEEESNDGQQGPGEASCIDLTLDDTANENNTVEIDDNEVECLSDVVATPMNVWTPDTTRYRQTQQQAGNEPEPAGRNSAAETRRGRRRRRRSDGDSTPEQRNTRRRVAADSNSDPVVVDGDDQQGTAGSQDISVVAVISAGSANYPGRPLVSYLPQPLLPPPLLFPEQPPPPPDTGKTVVIKCPCCLEDVSTLSANKHWISTNCGHIYCNICIKEAIKTKKSCPICRKPLVRASQYHRLHL